MVKISGAELGVCILGIRMNLKVVCVVKERERERDVVKFRSIHNQSLTVLCVFSSSLACNSYSHWQKQKILCSLVNI